MKTKENLFAICTADRAAYRAFCASRREMAATLGRLRKEHSTPAETVAAFVAAVGQSEAAEIVASMVNTSAWDGRISPRNAAWAASVEHAWNADAARDLCLYPDFISLHKAHLNQIAGALRGILGV